MRRHERKSKRARLVLDLPSKTHEDWSVNPCAQQYGLRGLCGRNTGAERRLVAVCLALRTFMYRKRLDDGMDIV